MLLLALLFLLAALIASIFGTGIAQVSDDLARFVFATALVLVAISAILALWRDRPPKP